MDEQKDGFLAGITHQLPTAIALLLSFILGNLQWSSTINRGIAEQTKTIDGITATLEKITITLSDITKTLEGMKKG
jgi:hypothetical protein